MSVGPIELRVQKAVSWPRGENDDSLMLATRNPPARNAKLVMCGFKPPLVRTSDI